MRAARSKARATEEVLLSATVLFHISVTQLAYDRTSRRSPYCVDLLCGHRHGHFRVLVGNLHANPNSKSRKKNRKSIRRKYTLEFIPFIGDFPGNPAPPRQPERRLTAAAGSRFYFADLLARVKLVPFPVSDLFHDLDDLLVGVRPRHRAVVGQRFSGVVPVEMGNTAFSFFVIVSFAVVRI
jgi:hypothetical protein